MLPGLLLLSSLMFQLPPVITNPAIGHAICPIDLIPRPPQAVMDTLSWDAAGVPRPNRAPNTLFPGDTGCDIGAFQFTIDPGIPPSGSVVTISIVAH